VRAPRTRQATPQCVACSAQRRAHGKVCVVRAQAAAFLQARGYARWHNSVCAGVRSADRNDCPRRWCCGAAPLRSGRTLEAAASSVCRLASVLLPRLYIGAPGCSRWPTRKMAQDAAGGVCVRGARGGPLPAFRVNPFTKFRRHAARWVFASAVGACGADLVSAGELCAVNRDSGEGLHHPAKPVSCSPPGDDASGDDKSNAAS